MFRFVAWTGWTFDDWKRFIKEILKTIGYVLLGVTFILSYSILASMFL